MIALACAMLAACGGNGNAKKEATVEDKAIQLMEKMVSAMENGNLNKCSAIEEEMEDWYDTLSEEEQEKVDDTSDAWEKKNKKRIKKAMNKLLEARVTELCEDMLEAMEAQDWELMESISEEMDEWYESLSEDEQEIADDAADAWEKKNKKRIEKADKKLEELYY